MMKKIPHTVFVDIDEVISPKVRVVVKGELISQDERFAYVMSNEGEYVELPREFLERHNRAS